MFLDLMVTLKLNPKLVNFNSAKLFQSALQRHNEFTKRVRTEHILDFLLSVRDLVLLHTFLTPVSPSDPSVSAKAYSTRNNLLQSLEVPTDLKSALSWHTRNTPRISKHTNRAGIQVPPSTHHLQEAPKR